MLRNLCAVLVLVSTLLGIGWLGHVRSSLSQTAHSPLQSKMMAADRVVHYRFDAHHGPVFHLDGDEVELRLVTHLVLEPGRTYHADQTYDYGLHLRIADPDMQTIWERDVHTSTRQSKDDWADGYWMRENAFSLEPGTEVTDDRVHLITLPRNIPWGSRFFVNLESPAASHGLLRAYERSLNTSLDLAIAYFGPDNEEEERLVGRLTYLPWEELTKEQRMSRLQLRWNRVSAVGELGTDYEVDTIFYTGFRALPAELPPPPPTTIVDDRATALTAWGPGQLSVSIHAECTTTRRAGAPAPAVDVVHLDAMGVVDGRLVDPCVGEDFEVWLPEGPHTLHVRGHALPETIVEAWYDDHREPPLDLPGLEEGRPLRPTITRSPRVRLLSGALSADYALVEPDDLESAMLQIRAHLPVPPRSLAQAQQPATVRYAFVDRHGRPLESGEWQVEPSPRLEEYEWVIDASDAEHEQWVSPVRTARIIAPEGSHHLRLEAEGEVIVSLYTYWSGMEERRTPHPPYDETMLVGTLWRRVPYDYQRWHRLEPHNAHVLQREGQTVDLAGPVRLELPGHGDARDYWMPSKGGDDDDDEAEAEPSPTTSPWVAMVPFTSHERRTVLERTDGDSPWARYARWRPGRATLTLDDDWGATLVYLVDGDPAEALGQELSVTLDGQSLQQPIVSTRGSLRLPRLGRGRHQLELGALPRGVRVYIDRPRLVPDRGPTEAYRVVTLYRLDRKRMGLYFDKTGAQQDYVNAITYRCEDRRPSRLSVVLDEGRPLRRRGVTVERVTAAARERTLPARGERSDLVFLDRPQQSCETLGRVPIPLGADLSGGRHELGIRVQEGPAVWVRFFRRGTAAPKEERALEWTERVLDLDLGRKAEAP